VTEAELRWLCGNALGFVLPSLLEDFGLPPLEAAGHGLLSVVSRGGAQEEAVGEAGILVDPLNVESIAAGMGLLVDMPAEERAARVAAIRRHAASLTLERFVGAWRALLARNAPPPGGG
jgi:glycosyltransferase involved in cell wall biosynthesis